MNEITGITATLDGSERLGQQAVPSFAVPRERFNDLLALFTPVKAEQLPGECIELGSLQIASRNGKRDEIKLYWFGTMPVLFTLNGQTCVRGGHYDPFDDHGNRLDETLAVCGVLREMSKEAQGEQSDKIADLLSILGRSAGRK